MGGGVSCEDGGGGVDRETGFSVAYVRRRPSLSTFIDAVGRQHVRRADARKEIRVCFEKVRRADMMKGVGGGGARGATGSPACSPSEALKVPQNQIMG